jgi:hypothetical protein
MVRDAAKMLASTMKESMCVPSESSTGLRWWGRTRGLLEKLSCLISQSSTVCQVLEPLSRLQVPRHSPANGQEAVLSRRSSGPRSFIDDSTSEQHHQARLTAWTIHGHVLLRKEVIQPHLPVRLPCYDFVPIASPTFDGSLHKGWATGFGCCRLS